MPNGKAGDHWYTDITSARLPTFSRAIDDLILELDQLAAGTEPYTAWDSPKRQQIERIVDAHLDRVGYDVLAGRGQTIGMEYRNLTPEQLVPLEEDLRRLRESL